MTHVHINDAGDGLHQLADLHDQRTQLFAEYEKKLMAIGRRIEELRDLTAEALLKERYGVHKGMRAVICAVTDYTNLMDMDPTSDETLAEDDALSVRVFAGLVHSVKMIDELTQTIYVSIMPDSGPAEGVAKHVMLSQYEKDRIWLAGDKAIPADVVAKINQGV